MSAGYEEIVANLKHEPSCFVRSIQHQVFEIVDMKHYSVLQLVPRTAVPNAAQAEAVLLGPPTEWRRARA